MESAREVGCRIAAIRNRRGLTQDQLAKRIGRTVGALSALERGLRKPAFDTLLCLAAALGVPVGDFFAPASGCGVADGPEHAVLYGELLDLARALPLAELEMTTRIVAVVARRHADGH